MKENERRVRHWLHATRATRRRTPAETAVLLDVERPGAERAGLRLRDDLDPDGRIDHDRALRRPAGLEARQPLEVAHQPLVLSRPRTAERTRRGLPLGHGAENAASRPAGQRQAGGAGPATL